MIWSERQLRQVRFLVVSESVHHAAVTAAMGERLVRRFCDRAATYRVTVHQDDVTLQVTQDPSALDFVTVAARWQPQTTVVQLMGGPMDGGEYQVQTLGEPLVLETWTPPSPREWEDVAFGDPTPLADTVQTVTVTYVLRSWSQTSRTWVYAPAR